MKCIVVHSGGMDSSICLALAIREFGADQVLSLSFQYGQRHVKELDQAKKICDYFKVKNMVVPISSMEVITDNALMNKNSLIGIEKGDSAPNTLVVGRNGLMARLAAVHANHLDVHRIYFGVIEVEEANSGYRDCSRSYMDLMQEILRIDLDNKQFEIITPLVKMTKSQTMQVAYDLGVLEYLLEETITCYEGLAKEGCKICPACHLRNEGIVEFLQIQPDIKFSYKNRL